MGQSFITARLSLWLDLVRAVAAIAVLLGHIVQLGLYSGSWPFTIALQKNAVTVFFVLSGLVIASSVARGRGGHRGGLGEFALARAKRVVPVAMLGIGAGLLVAALGDASEAPLFAGAAQWPGNGEILRAVLFVSESWNSGFAPNPLMWSLVYEVWFYALFGAAMFLRGWNRAIWLAVLAAAAGPNILLLLPAWLVGAGLCHWTAARDLPRSLARPAAALAFAMLFVAPAIAPVLLEGLSAVLPGWDLGFSLYALSDNLLAIAVVAGFIGLRKLAEDGLAIPERWAGTVRAFANISFTLYLLHWPLLKALQMAGIGAGDSMVRFALLAALVVGACALLAMLVERRTPHMPRCFANPISATKKGPTLSGGPFVKLV